MTIIELNLGLLNCNSVCLSGLEIIELIKGVLVGGDSLIGNNRIFF